LRQIFVLFHGKLYNVAALLYLQQAKVAENLLMFDFQVLNSHSHHYDHLCGQEIV
jgi:hypothetical protein